MDFEETVCVCILLIRARRRRVRKRLWVNPLVSQRLLKGKFPKLYGDLRTSPKKFSNYFRMSINCFDSLLQLIGPRITFRNTQLRQAIPPEERLAVTLRYLGTGTSFSAIHFEYLLGVTTVREIVRDTCKKIMECLQTTYMPEKKDDDWISMANDFYLKTSFPNCVGAGDGKYIRLSKPDENGSQSLILMALSDANYRFVTVEVTTWNEIGDSNVFKSSIFGKKLERSELNIPPSTVLPCDDGGNSMPFVVVGGEAFALSGHVLRPYPGKNLTPARRNFNSRLTRALRIVECSFGILTRKWNILDRPLDVKPDFCEFVIKACCLLHNYILINDGCDFEETLYGSSLVSVEPEGTRGSARGFAVRDYFTSYFASPQGSLSWLNNENTVK